ncbi:MAG: prefoldin subunit alpha [Nanobdellota archaeon]
MPDNTQSSMNEKYMELEMVNQRLQELNAALQQIDSEIEHAQVALATLGEISKADDENELLIPLGSETFLTVKTEDVKTVRQSVGAGVVVDKSTDNAIKTIKKQLNETRKHQEEYAKIYNEVVKKAEELQQGIEESISKQNT